MKKILIALLPVVFLAACTKDISRFNQETKRAANVPGGTLFSSATKALSDNMASASVNSNPLRFTVKHWAMAVYQDEAQYNFSTRAIPQNWWAAMYRDVLADYKESARIVSADPLIDPAVQTNQLAIIDLMQVYTFQVLVNSFGDIPYTEALDATILFPKYDDAKTIYTDLLARLNADLGKLDAAKGSFAAAEDVVYKGDVSKWIKFANTLKLKMGMTIADDDAGAAKAAVESADAGAFSSAADNGLFTYLGASPNTNPLYADIVLGGRGDYVAAKDLMDPLIAMNDPRKSLFFGTNNAGDYVGGVVGTVNTFADVSKPSDKVSAPADPFVFLDYTETEFLRAEAVERGFAVTGTAASHYENGIRSSIIYWGGTDAQATTYLGQASVAYATAAGSYKAKIGFQKWIALYNRAFDAWTEYRRLDAPVLPLAVGAYSGFPVRYTYPNNEQQLNGANYSAAAAKIGGDVVETKIFWDKN